MEGQVEKRKLDYRNEGKSEKENIMQEQEVVVIPAKPKVYFSPETGKGRRKKVAAYARVSTETEEQANSYQAQVDYYTKLIQTNTAWDFVEVYTDE